MVRRVIVKLKKGDVKSYEVSWNKFYCARQAVSPAALPAGVPLAAAEKFFREAIFALGDAQYLVDHFFLREIISDYGLDRALLKRADKFFINYGTQELLLEE
ncbi:hypothetical protein NO1_0989 [Candidatus Termititenax aidoneus]|uniref:Uncharacterized protein n=1 Tax=Termititenax aidoneus TaxID=2218524 RepID=A0A388TAI5_TERA1|nr:hypothetical protein NO1_0989 [Candidatus Termititenax aidoneus]